jgi:hypothetical protein
MDLSSVRDQIAKVACANDRSLSAFSDLFEPWVADGIAWRPDQVPEILAEARRASVESGKLPYYPEAYAQPLANLLYKYRLNRAAKIPPAREADGTTREQWIAYKAYVRQRLTMYAPHLYERLVAVGKENDPRAQALHDAIDSQVGVTPTTFLAARSLLPAEEHSQYDMRLLVEYQNPTDYHNAQAQEAMA